VLLLHALLEGGQEVLMVSWGSIIICVLGVAGLDSTITGRHKIESFVCVGFVPLVMVVGALFVAGQSLMSRRNKSHYLA
jgi:hypothetical protein